MTLGAWRTCERIAIHGDVQTTVDLSTAGRISIGGIVVIGAIEIIATSLTTVHVPSRITDAIGSIDATS